jgi:hypothetical protein
MLDIQTLSSLLSLVSLISLDPLSFLYSYLLSLCLGMDSTVEPENDLATQGITLTLILSRQGRGKLWWVWGVERYALSVTAP